ncbi:hypothetical protein JOD47_000731 [Arthrobacter tumbae]|nr:hypothetical protein [Arthrobacter tumbae]
MWDSTIAVSSGSPAIGGIIGFAILLIIIGGILVRLVIAIFRRGKNEVKKDVLGPVFKSGGVQSELYGFKPTEAQDLQPKKRRSESNDSGRRT